jgi:type VI secretion system protein ImpA
MQRALDTEALLARVPGDHPAGEDLRYTVHEQIKEARREEDQSDRGLWERETKKADWEKTISLCTDALAGKSKDLQIAAWLTEALTVTDGFEGAATGLMIVRRLLEEFWENLYPPIDDGDLDYRVGRLEFINDQVAHRINAVPITDQRKAPGYSRLHYNDSRDVGYESDASKAKDRSEKMAEGKISAEEFDAAVARTSKAFFKTMNEQVETCHENFRRLENVIDQHFGKEAPRLAELRSALEECSLLVGQLYSEKLKAEPDAPGDQNPNQQADSVATAETEENIMTTHTGIEPAEADIDAMIQASAGQEARSNEDTVWRSASSVLQKNGLRAALDILFNEANSAPSIRDKNRYRLLMAKVCLAAQRPDLARPIVEELYALIEELNLERWESPKWIAEVLDALYKCLTTGEPGNEDIARATELFNKLCTLDATRAMMHRQS